MSAHPQSLIVAGAVILAAGASSRMGRPKLLLAWGDTSILGHLLRRWQELGVHQTAIVCAPDNPPLHAELDRLGVPAGARILNPAPDEGMFSSVRAAAGWTGWAVELTHWMVSLGDQPHVRFETLQQLMKFSAAHPDKICQPARSGRARHPVLLPAAIFAELPVATEADLKQFLLNRSEQRALCEVDDPGLDFDLDRPEDYERALAGGEVDRGFRSKGFNGRSTGRE